MKKLVKFALVIGGMAFAAKLAAAKKSDWQGLTEAAVREKLDERLPDRVPSEKRSVIADKVVSTLRERGVLREEEQPAETSSGENEGPASADTEMGDATPDSTETA